MSDTSNEPDNEAESAARLGVMAEVNPVAREIEYQFVHADYVAFTE